MIDNKDYISKTNEFTEFSALAERLRAYYGISYRDLFEMLAGDRIPIQIFSTNLTPLESLTKYLKENLHKSFAQIAELLRKSPQSIYQAYRHAREKMSVAFTFEPKEYAIPLLFFKDSKRSVLSTVVAYLVIEHRMSVTQIASLLNRSPSSIWIIKQKVPAERKSGVRAP